LPILILLFSCKKDKSISPCNPTIVDCQGQCEELLRIDTLTFGYVPSNHGVHHYNPFFDPSSNDRFVYLEKDYGTGVTRLMTHERSSGISSEILSTVSFANGFLNEPKWTSTNWIVFTTLSVKNVWKIRPDGSGLTQLTLSGNFIFPEVNPAGDRIIAFVNSIGGVIMDTAGTFLDTIQVGFPATWTSSNRIYAPAGATLPDYGIGYYDFIADSVKQVNTWGYTEGRDQIEAIQWCAIDNQILYSRWSNSLFLDPENFSQADTTKKGCYKHFFDAFDISPLDGEIIASKLYVDSITPSHELAISRYIVTFDKGGCNETAIELP